MSPKPLVVQEDLSLLLEVGHPRAEECRLAIAGFAELERTPEHVHTYRVTPLGLWNARAAGLDAGAVCGVLVRYSRFPVPRELLAEVAEVMERHGRLVLQDEAGGGLSLHADDAALLEEVTGAATVSSMVGERLAEDTVAVDPAERGRIKQALVKLGWPADDQAGYVEGAPYEISLDESDGFSLRPYQSEAVDAFHRAGTGVVVLPCGAGKTLVGAGAIAAASTRVLVLVTNMVSARQWRAELLARTSLGEDEIGEYSGQRKEICPVTIATYQIITARGRGGKYRHFEVFTAEDWGLVIYDEVHLLPAPVFRLTAEIQSRRRLGLTATLVREDGREDDVFSLIGPKRFDIPWRDMEAQGWIATAFCTEVRVTLTERERMAYANADAGYRHEVAATAWSKTEVVEAILARHPEEPCLVIGMYLEHLTDLAARLGAPLITGETPMGQRESLYAAFRSGRERVLVVSKVANFSVDLPEASVAVQVSGTFGSRQEEAQRLGRILRPKTDGRQARFYSVVSRDTNEQEFAARRQRFLAEQGYAYTVVDAEDLPAPAGGPLASGTGA